MTTLKINVARFCLALGLGISMAAIVTSITGCVSDSKPSNPNQAPVYFKPTFEGDEHAQPVYTSPSVAPATTNLPAAATPP
jgi:hypothetical protein